MLHKRSGPYIFDNQAPSAIVYTTLESGLMHGRGVFIGGDVARKAIKVKPLEIMRYWAPILAERYGDPRPPHDPISDWISMIDQGRLGTELSARTHFYKRYCFACGPFAGNVKRVCQRSHIKSVFDGGTDDVSNLHMLCDSCHSMSEFLSGSSYWQWLDDMNEQPAGWTQPAQMKQVITAARAMNIL